MPPGSEPDFRSFGWGPREDIIEEVEVVAAEEQEKVSMQEREDPPVEALGALAVELQVELSSAKEQDPRATVRLRRKDHQKGKRPLHQRSAIIQGLADFWANPIMNPRHVPFMSRAQDEDMLNNMMDLKVGPLQSRCKLVLSFWDNPVLQEHRYRACISSRVHWFSDNGCGAPSLRLDTCSLNHVTVQGLCVHPLQHLPRRKGPAMSGK
ncbi:hypothetical protein FD754_025195 [Muntiacus muntjak]|uniref:Uncharacterized protein n=1 Tax=Muntiacus muntjak TaxID=9888 RepID=A0A5N3UL95_MUNMU|nr:hypothetical protein FD754_025196 [Muntiacus muntjak]KAB0337425.1 hypothetical protein FD754_025195 [Muntiacus muntjak]